MPSCDIASLTRSTSPAALSGSDRMARSKSSQKAKILVSAVESAWATASVTEFMKLLELDAPIVDAVVTYVVPSRRTVNSTLEAAERRMRLKPTDTSRDARRDGGSGPSNALATSPSDGVRGYGSDVPETDAFTPTGRSPVPSK